MTAADKLRELLATRPANPNSDELAGWWATSTVLLSALVLDLEAIDCDLVAARAALSKTTEAGAQLGRDLDAERGAHRRTQDERAKLRVELDGVKRLASEACDLAHERTTVIGDGRYGRINDIRAALLMPTSAEDPYFRGYADGKRTAQWSDAERERLERQLDAARGAARTYTAHVDNLGALADDNDPRAMALAAPIGEAHADLWIALGLDTDEEVDRMREDIESRCAVCGWKLAATIEQGCVRGNCSLRPRPERLYAPERAAAEALATPVDVDHDELCCPQAALGAHDIGCRGGGKVH